MRIAFALAVVAALGCSKASKSQVIPRDKDAGPAVVVVDRKPTGVKVEQEREPNNTVDKATALAIPGTVKGTLDGSADVDVYKLTVAKAVNVSVRLGGIAKVDLALELRDAEGKSLVKSDRGPAGTEEGFPNYKLEAGTYYVAVTEFVKKSKRKRRRRRSKRKRRKKAPPPEAPARVGKSPPYELSVAPASRSEEHHEREPNGTIDEALELSVAEYQGFGYAGWSGDVDVWKLSLDGAGNGKGMSLDLTGVPGVSFTLEVLDGSGKRLLRRKGGKGQPLAVRNLMPKEGDQAYFVKLRARRSNPKEAYELRYTTSLLEPDEEHEPNDSTGRASKLQPDDKTFSGTWKGYLGAGDVDYWLIDKQKGPTLFSVTVTPPRDTDITLKARVDGKVIGEGNSGKRGEREQFTQIPIPAGKRMVLKISGWGATKPSGHYTLQWSLVAGSAPAPAAPSVDDDYE